MLLPLIFFVTVGLCAGQGRLSSEQVRELAEKGAAKCYNGMEVTSWDGSKFLIQESKLLNFDSKDIVAFYFSSCHRFLVAKKPSRGFCELSLRSIRRRDIAPRPRYYTYQMTQGDLITDVPEEKSKKNVKLSDKLTIKVDITNLKAFEWSVYCHFFPDCTLENFESSNVSEDSGRSKNLKCPCSAPFKNVTSDTCLVIAFVLALLISSYGVGYSVHAYRNNGSELVDLLVQVKDLPYGHLSDKRPLVDTIGITDNNSSLIVLSFAAFLFLL